MAGGAPVRVDADLGEVRRPHVWSADHRVLARAYVDGTCHQGWEPHREVVARFDAAVTRHAAQARDRVLVIGTHGMAPTVWLASRVRLRPDPGTFWSGLRFPDAIRVDLTAGTAGVCAIGPGTVH